MSGFFGMLRLDGEPIRESLLKEIAEELRFRGPDGVNFCFDGAIGGCFARMRRAEEFDELSKVVQRVPERRIIPHQDPTKIGELCELILADTAGI
jgi:hypothetical protein